VECHDDGQRRAEATVVDVLQPFMHVDDVDVTPCSSGENLREMADDDGLPVRRHRAAIIAKTLRDGNVLLARHDGIGGARNDRAMAEGSEPLVDVADDGFDGPIALTGRDRLVERSDVEDIQWPRVCQPRHRCPRVTVRQTAAHFRSVRRVHQAVGNARFPGRS